MARRVPLLLLAGALLVAACGVDSGVAGDVGRPVTTAAPTTTAASPDSTDGTEPPTTPEATDPPTDGGETTAPPSTDAPAGDDPGDEQVGGFVPAPLVWFDERDGVDSTFLEVPIDYGDPDGQTMELYLARHRATDPANRIGTLLVNPGGPGFGGSDFAFFAPQVFEPILVERFDILGWDPRGTGSSEPAIDCIDDYDTYFGSTDVTPDSDEERQQIVALAADFAGECVRNNKAIIEHVGTNNAVRDMEIIRRALGEETISYFGFSYGSELGATWATMFPARVRAAVLDGAADPAADSLESGLQQYAAFEDALEVFLARCTDDPECVFHNGGDAEGAFDRLMAELDEQPLPGPDGRIDVGRNVATTAVIQAMYSETYWRTLARALTSAQAGDGSGLLELHDSYYQRYPDGTYGNELEAFQSISCADSAERLTVEEEDALAPRFTEVAPRLAPEGSSGGYFCTFFPPAIDPRIEITGAGAGPIVVIGTTGDTATPLESTRRMAETLEDGRLVIVEADQHTGYSVNQCVRDVVSDYLVDLVAPEFGTECR